MKSLLIILILVGNALLPSMHYMLHHSHSDNEGIDDCQQCIIVEDNNNYDLDSQNLNYSGDIQIILLKLSSFNSINFNLKYSSRAPPIL